MPWRCRTYAGSAPAHSSSCPVALAAAAIASRSSSPASRTLFRSYPSSCARRSGRVRWFRRSWLHRQPLQSQRAKRVYEFGLCEVRRLRCSPFSGHGCKQTPRPPIVLFQPRPGDMGSLAGEPRHGIDPACCQPSSTRMPSHACLAAGVGSSGCRRRARLAFPRSGTPVTNQVTTTPGNPSQSATCPDSAIPPNCGNPTHCDAVRVGRARSAGRSGQGKTGQSPGELAVFTKARAGGGIPWRGSMVVVDGIRHILCPRWPLVLPAGACQPREPLADLLLMSR